ncbi:MAG TPA: nucleotidyltransferase domain-containing protein [Thermoanaerobaculia bacterium]|jgi:predicted nucleotidyltransferase
MEPRSEAEKALAELVAQLREAAGPNLLGVALYGGLAKGRYTPGISDVNVLIVLAEAGLERLLPLSPAITRALRESRVTPFVVTPEDLRASARLFPGKVLDMQESHRVLWGDVHLDGIAVAPADLRLRARQEIKNTELRLRLRAVERSGDPDALWRGLMASLPKIAVTLETLLRLDGVAVPVDRPGLLRLAARELGIPADQMEPFTELRRVDQRPEDERARRLYAAYLDLLSAISRRVEETAR